MRLEALKLMRDATGDIVPGQQFTDTDSHGAWLVDNGYARRLPDPDASAFVAARGRWSGATVVCLASGPSIDEADLGKVWAWRHTVDQTGRVVAVCSTIEGAPWADAHYAGDLAWFREYGRPRVLESWTRSEQAHLDFPGVLLAPSLEGPSSGHQALDLIRHFGAAKIVLVGFDCAALRGRQQWHAPHRNPPTSQPYAVWAKAFIEMAPGLPTVVNCSRRTALTCFPRVALEDEFAPRASAVA